MFHTPPAVETIYLLAQSLRIKEPHDMMYVHAYIREKITWEPICHEHNFDTRELRSIAPSLWEDGGETKNILERAGWTDASELCGEKIDDAVLRVYSDTVDDLHELRELIWHVEGTDSELDRMMEEEEREQEKEDAKDEVVSGDNDEEDGSRAKRKASSDIDAGETQPNKMARTTAHKTEGVVEGWLQDQVAYEDWSALSTVVQGREPDNDL